MNESKFASHAAPPPSRSTATVNGDRLDVATEIRALKPYIHPPVPNPAPLGLFCFGVTTTLLMMKHTEWTGDSSVEKAGVDKVVMGFAMFFGGFVQLIAGLTEILRNNIFGYTAFCVYGGFWMSVGTIDIVTMLATGAPATNPKAMQTMLFLIALISFVLWILTFKINKTICALFFFLVLTCFFLSVGTRNEAADKLGGYLGVITCINAFWLAFAELVNDVMGEGKEIIPLGHWHTNKTPHSGGVHIPGRILPTSPSIYLRPNERFVPPPPTVPASKNANSSTLLAVPENSQDDDDDDAEDNSNLQHNDRFVPPPPTEPAFKTENSQDDDMADENSNFVAEDEKV